MSQAFVRILIEANNQTPTNLDFDLEASSQTKNENSQNLNRNINTLKRRFKAQVNLTNKRPKIRVFNIKENNNSMNKIKLSPVKSSDLSTRIKVIDTAESKCNKESMS